MKQRFIICFLVLLLPLVLFGGTSGKISGTVVDKATGKPLAGVNVILEGAAFTLGDASGVDGHYVILSVPPDVYKVRASYIGRKDMVVSEVKVSSGLTTELNFEMEESTIEGQVVEVVAERKLFEKDATSSVSIVSVEQLESLPVRGTQNIIASMAGVVVQDGNVHIRGGRSDEVNYYVEGASAVNPMNNTNAVTVINEAIQEMQVLAGGYTADMGGANAGIIKQEFRTGGNKLNGSIDYQQDGFGDPTKGDQFLNTYTYGHQVGVLTLGGPLFSDNIRFFVAGEYENEDDRQLRFSDGYEFGTGREGLDYEDVFVDANPDNNAFGHDTVSIEYPDGFTPHNSNERYTMNGTLLFDLPIKIRLGGAYTHQKWDIENTPMLDVLNERYPYNVSNTLLLTGKATMVMGANSYLDLKASHYQQNRERGDSWFDHDWEKYYDSTAVAEHGVTYRNAWQPMYRYEVNGFPMERNGDPNNFYFKDEQSYLSLGSDFVSQMSHHQIKAGVDFRRYTIRSFDIAPSVMLYTADPAVGQRLGYETFGSIDAIPPSTWFNEGYIDAYGYDIYGEEVSDKKSYGDSLYVDGPKHPIQFATYLQDKVEFNDLIINAGIRLDYFNSDDKELKDPMDPAVETSTGIITEDSWKEKDASLIISPRLGFSFPATDKTVFFMQYGKFAQMPTLNNIYNSTFTMSRQIYSGGFYYINPIGFGLDPIETTSYEVGLRQQVANNAAVEVTAFYKNEKGKVQVYKQQVAATSVVSTSYERFVNQDFATTKGLEFRLTIRPTMHFSGEINYTYTNAEGTASNSTSYHGAVYRLTQKPTTINPLDYSQAHTGSFNLRYQLDKDEGGFLFSQFGANLLFTFSSGHPFTKVYVPAGGQVTPYNAGTDYMLDTRSRQAVEPIGSSMTPWVYLTDLNLFKSFDLTKSIRATVYMRINNLFNRKNVLNVYQMTGSAEDDGYITDENRSGSTINNYGGQKYVDMYNAVNVINGQSYWDEVGDELYGQPRQIFFGMKIDF